MSITFPKFLFIGIALIVAIFTAYAANQMYLRNKAGWHLKLGMAYIKNRIIDERTLQHLDKAYEIFPYNPRIIENRALAYSIYYMRRKAEIAIPYDKIFEILRENQKEDPYSAGMLINLAGINLTRAQQLMKLGNKELAQKHIDDADKQFKTLLQVLPFHQDTYSTGGLVNLLRGKYNTAEALYQKALEINPADRTSQVGLRSTRARRMAHEMVEKQGVNVIGE